MSGINKHVQHIRTSSIEYVKILKENIPSTANIIQLSSVPLYNTIISNETNGIENPLYIQVTTNNWYYKLISKKPSIDNLLYGEIAIAYKKGFETLFIKNSNNEIIEFLPVNRLPSYVDDVVEYTNRESFPTTGEKGKIYVDTTENDIYRWTGSTYIKITGIIGAQGIQGIQGFQGYQGLQGEKGEQGIQGFQGFQGKSGVDGTQGTQGYQGFQGYQGLQGEQGIQGIQGFQGKSGVDGIQGATGIQGFQGLQGEKGEQGIQGYQGYQGYQGKSGVDGTQGLQGIIGPQGPSRFESNIISVTPPDSNNNTLTLISQGTVRGYKYISLTNAIDPTNLYVEVNDGSNDIEYVVLLKNNTTSQISFNNLTTFTFTYNKTTCSGLYPNDLRNFSLNSGEAVEISFMYNSEFGGIIVSLGNIYTSTI